MKLNIHTPDKSLDRAFLKQPINRDSIELFKTNLKDLIGRINDKESEEHHKNLVRDFLKNTFYKADYEINTKGKQDLVIHTGKSASDKVGVILEAKKPTNTSDMISAANPNRKALHELVLYFLRERIDEKNSDVRKLIITNINEWFIFDASVFNRLFVENSAFVKEYEKWRDKQKTTAKTDLFYGEIKAYVDQIEGEIECAYFDIRDYKDALENDDLQDDETLIELYKILSPHYLLKIPFADDSNKLDRNFYTELLHIIGLEETGAKGKVKIDRKAEERRNPASLVENAMAIIETKDSLHKVKNLESYGATKDQRIFGVALELCLTWINRVLFLKLLEAQLVEYHGGDRDFRFLDTKTIADFDELFTLFHQVLAKTMEDQSPTNRTKYARIPYLNSSLFEISELETETITIESLKDTLELPFNSSSILKETHRNQSGLPTLEYLFSFLDAYDFASETAETIIEQNRPLINASVLGKIFEKINNAKAGSIYTPGFITMYMCRQAIRLAIVQKFKDKFEIDIETFEDLEIYVGRFYKTENIKEFNAVINSLRLCDPAVGSGHFLVSALNEIIAVKSKLGILADENGKTFPNFEITVENDELTVYDAGKSEFFKYQIRGGKPISAEAQRLQKTLFHEKQTIIENCLFGVDIIPHSVKICRLRLWIELLKNAYYKESGGFAELETLPNIDINIKDGNSLIRRFSLDTDLKQILKEIKYSVKDYKEFVLGYKETRDREKKRDFESKIKRVKEDFKTQLFFFSPERRKLADLENQLKASQSKQFLFGETSNEKSKRLNFETSLNGKIESAKKGIKQVEENAVFKGAFEWRFEFPEVLNNEGEFLGFDLIIGNPPYGVSIKGELREKVVEIQSKVPDYEIYYFFLNLSNQLLKENGLQSLIIPNTILFNVFAKDYRESIFDAWNILEILDCTEFNIFEGSAVVRNIITLFEKNISENLITKVGYKATANAESFEELSERKASFTDKQTLLENNRNWGLVFKLNFKTLNLVAKIKESKNALSEFFPEISQGLIAYDQYQGQDKETIKNRAFHSFERRKGLKKWLWGEDITRYSVVWNEEEWIDYCEGVANPREPKYFKNERILIREITNPSIFAGYTKEELYNDPAIINILKPKREILSIKVLLGLLNSKLATYYHFNSSPKATKGAFPKILVDDIKKFPIPKLKEKDQQPFAALVDQILESKKQGADTQALEDEIDRLVYRLYDLTTEEIAIVEGKA